MKKNLFYLLMIFAANLWVACGENEPESGPQTVAVTGVTLNKSSLSLETGASETLNVSITPVNATNKDVKWTSDNEKIAEVSAAGLVTAKAKGTATITAATTDGGKTATCIVTVEAKYFATFKFAGKDYRIADDKTCIFTKQSDSYFVVSCSDAVTKQALTISVAKEIKKGQSYDIYSGSPYVMSDIKLLFTAGETIAEESFWTSDMSQVGIIGKLTITEMTDNLLSGTFSCRSTNGELTEGTFYVKAREWE